MQKQLENSILRRCKHHRIKKGFNDQQIINVENVYRVIYVQNSNMTTALNVADLELPKSDEKEVVLDFIRNSTKGIMRGLS